MKNILLLCVFLIASCSVKSVQTDISAGTDPREQELRTVIAEAGPLVRNLLIALNSGAYTSYIKDFDNSSRTAFTEDRFSALQEKIKKKLGLYEDGKCQVNKIEKYPDFYMIYYFVKFRNGGAGDPVVMCLKIAKTAGELKVREVSYRHALLET